MLFHHGPTFLPDDVLRLVIDIFATEAECRNDIFRLLPVSKNFKEWAEPHAYSKIILRNREKALSFIASLHGEFAFCQPARHVRHLWLLYTDPPVAQSFHNVYSKCPKLAHFAFDGKNTPSVGSSAGRTLEKGYLSRLSICSPILLEDEFFRSGPPISYELITHLHIFAPGGLGDRNFYNEVFVEHMHQLGSLSHLVIEITYPSPAMLRSDKYEIIFGDALFNINLSDSLIRNFFVRVPSLREVVVKSIPPYPSFRNLWDGLKAALKDEPRIIFMQTMDDKQKAHCESALSDKSAAVCSSAWQDLLVNALDEVDQYWSSEQ